MAYATTNPPTLFGQAIAGQRIWLYVSADAIATVNTAAYFSNGDALGLKVNDIVWVIDTATPTSGIAIVRDVTAGGQADISDGLAVTMTDTD